MGLPAEPHLEFLPCAELAQIIQNCAAFVSRQPVDMGGEVAIDVERFALCHRMGANDRVRCRRVDLAGFLAAYPGIVPAIDMIARMRCGQPFEIDLHTRGKRVIGRILASEERVAAAGRHRVEVENATHRRLLVTGDIRVPIFPVDALGTGIGMDWQDFGVSLGAGRVGVNMQFTEVAAEPLVGFHIQRLIAEEQNQVLGQRLMQLLYLMVAERLRQGDAFNIGADARRHRRHTYGFIAHSRILRWQIMKTTHFICRLEVPKVSSSTDAPCGPQFSATPLALMIAAHFLISRLTNPWRYSGDLRSGATTSAPSSLSRSCTAGLSIVATVASCSLPMMAVGVPVGKKKACQLSTSKSLRPCSCALARFGRTRERFLVRIAIAFASLPSSSGMAAVALGHW